MKINPVQLVPTKCAVNAVLKSHKDSSAKLASAKEKFREKFPDLPAVLSAAINSFKKGREPNVKCLRGILLFCFDIVTPLRQKPYYLDELRKAYAAQPDKLRIEESTINST